MMWEPLVLTEARIIELWEKMQEFPMLFDDFGRGNFDQYMAKMFSPANIFIDIEHGLGLAAGMSIRPRLDCVLHLVMFDRRLRGRESLFLEIMSHFFKRLELRRMTAIIADDCRTALNLVQRLGFKEEGNMRNAMLKEGKYVDVHIYGILAEEMASDAGNVGDGARAVAAGA